MLNHKILVIEDEEIFALDIRKRLQELGYTVSEITKSGEEALRKIAETHPNLVLIGTRLAGKINGVQIADIVMNTFQVPVLYLAEYLEVTRFYKNWLREPCSYILKRIAERDLHIAIEMALYKHYTERKLQEEKQKVTAVLQSMGCAVVVTDASGQIQMMNPLAEALTACKQDEATAKDLASVLKIVDKKTREAIEDLVLQVMQENVALNLPENSAFLTEDSREIHIEGTIAPVRDEDGKIKGTVLVFQDITQRKQIEAELVRNAFYDALTALPNRALFLERLGQAFERSKRRNNYQFAVLFLDLDGFKTINDSFGHTTGDSLLVEIARRLELCLRGGDTVARFGGDEFAILIEDIKDLSDAIKVAKRIQEVLRLPFYINGHKVFMAASIGIALNGAAYNEPSELLRDADIAMYRAKEQGKARYVIFNSDAKKNDFYTLKD